MQNLFINTYNLFTRKKYLFIAILVAIIAITAFFLSKIKLEEDIRAIIPRDGKIEKINLILNNSKFSDQIILNFSCKDTSKTDAKLLKTKAEEIVSFLEKDTVRIKKIRFKVESNSFQDVYNFFYNHIPFYLSDADYKHLEKNLTEEEIENTLKRNFKSLISPAGIATKKFIFKDPFSITPLALKKLQNFQLDDNFTIYNSCIYTKNKKNLLVFIDPVYPSSNTDKNRLLIDSLENAITQVLDPDPIVNIEYYGGTVVAVANANRIKTDIMLTVTIAFVIIFILFLLFFRKVKVLLLLFLPVILGAGLAISVLTIIYGNVSVIALSVGAILVGISIDYSLHAFTHFRSSGSITQTLKDISLPILMSSFTTASAFLCLFIVNSEALNQLGLFGAISIFFSALIVLLLLPVFISGKGFKNPEPKIKFTFFDKIAAFEIHKKKPAILIIILLSIVFLFTFKNIRFNTDIATLNYLPDHLAKAEKNLEAISSETQSAVFFVTIGNSLQEALQKTENQKELLHKAQDKGLFSSMSSGADLLLSTQHQEEKIKQWNSFWDSINRTKIESLIKEKGTKNKFKENAFNEFYNLINKKFEPIPLDDFNFLQNSFLSNYINTSDSLYSVISILKVTHKNKPELFGLFNKSNDVIIFDKQYFSNKFFKVLKDDFNKLVILSILIVFGILLFFFGRIEIALITFAPIMISWLWTLGLMGLFNIEFNIFNIIISTFIFGLGIDYSIFIMRGLLNNYKYGNHLVTPYKLSVLLSAITTILGIGVLILAKHPALKSIALVSIFGIASVVIISYTILPLLFTLLTTQKGKIRKEPLTMGNSIISVLTFVVFLVNTIILTLSIPILYILPIPRKYVKYIFHWLLYMTSRFIVKINFTIKKESINKYKIDFSKPSVIVSNHQSHLDLVLILRLHPKIIVMTNKWVWNNPFYGFVVRFADYFPIYKGVDQGFDNIKKKVKEGYSILVFPEGTRTVDGSIKRYHQGAFKLADDFNLDIQPVLIHGAYQCIPKTEFFMRSGKITTKFFDRIEVKSANLDNNETYRQQAKDLTKFARTEFEKLKLEKENTSFYRQRVVNQYIFKGPILEWYVKVKLKLEKDYKFFNERIPRKANIVDIGCGYGYLAYMLKYTSDQRVITGIDYDDEKIAVANQIATKYTGINFLVKDITEEEIPAADVYILKDVLHYMPENLQIEILNKCMSRLSDKGIIIIRDADADLEKRTNVTKKTEIQSTKIFKFNKTKYDLTYISGKKISDLAKSNGFICERFDNAKKTSNITYIIRK
ncbi:MAG: MMPL family transporter [Bacteroidota bacterium]